MQIDLLFDPFDATWPDVREGAIAAEAEGFDGVWLYDHLAGSVHGQERVLECWTTLTAIAATVPRLAIGPMVLNVANRDPGTLGVMAATLQHVSGGRLLLGLGAGGGRATPYAAEQHALGRAVPGDRARRAAVEAAVATLRATWSGSVGGVSGFWRPDPPPPIIIGAFGPKNGRPGRPGRRWGQPGGRTRPGRRHRGRPGRPPVGGPRPGVVCGHRLLAADRSRPRSGCQSTVSTGRWPWSGRRLRWLSAASPVPGTERRLILGWRRRWPPPE